MGEENFWADFTVEQWRAGQYQRCYRRGWRERSFCDTSWHSVVQPHDLLRKRLCCAAAFDGQKKEVGRRARRTKERFFRPILQCWVPGFSMVYLRWCVHCVCPRQW